MQIIVTHAPAMHVVIRDVEQTTANAAATVFWVLERYTPEYAHNYMGTTGTPCHPKGRR